MTYYVPKFVCERRSLPTRPFERELSVILKAIYRQTAPKKPEKSKPEEKPVPEFMTAEEAAAFVGVHVETLRKWARLGVFPHVTLPGAGKDHRFTKASIDEWARNRVIGKPK